MLDPTQFITDYGSLVTIKRKTEGEEDGYGDPAVTWTADDDQERVMIQIASRARVSGIITTLAGDIDESDFIGFLLPASTIVGGCILEAGDLRYQVNKVVSSRIDDDTSLKAAYLSLLEEGT